MRRGRTPLEPTRRIRYAIADAIIVSDAICGAKVKDRRVERSAAEDTLPRLSPVSVYDR